MIMEDAHKHAYLIICHTNFDQLNILLDLLDDKRNDIFLLIDKKAKGYSFDTIKTHAVNSSLSFIKPIRINWGGDSQIKAEIKLLTEATKTPHDYYHLISGMDLPLKTQNEIHDYFMNNAGYDYVSMEWRNPLNLTKGFIDRVKYYYFFQNYLVRGKDGFLSKMQTFLLRIQKSLRINRIKHISFEFQKGSNWFSITHRTACYLLEEYKNNYKYFLYSLGADELLVQTLLNNSPLRDNIKDNDLRCIDWHRGGPYIFTQDDYDMLMNSTGLFARKFDYNVDKTIILKIRDTILDKQRGAET